MPDMSPLIGSLPLVAAAVVKLFPGRLRRITLRIKRLSAQRENLPDGPGKEAVDRTLDRLGSELAYQTDRAARRYVMPVMVGVLVLVVSAVSWGAWCLWSWGPALAKVCAVILATAGWLYALAGIAIFRVRDHLAFEHETPTQD